MQKDPASDWTFLTNHAHVLICLAKSPHARMRDMAVKVGITERAVQRIVHDLEKENFIEIKKDGRRNVYTPHEGKHLKHPIESRHSIADLLQLSARPKEDQNHES